MLTYHVNVAPDFAANVIDILTANNALNARAYIAFPYALVSDVTTLAIVATEDVIDYIASLFQIPRAAFHACLAI